jgi:hypothetical protein
VQPAEELDGDGHKPGEEQGGVRFAKKACASPRTCARARAPWIFSLSRCCRTLRS